MFLKTRTFEKKVIFPLKKNLAYFFSVIRTFKISKKTLFESRRFSDKHWACSKFIPLGPKRSTKTNFSKNSRFHGDKRLWPILFRIIQFDEPHETINMGQQVNLAITVEVVKSSL